MAERPLTIAQHIQSGKVRQFPIAMAAPRHRHDQWPGVARIGIITGLTLASWATILALIL